ncbi:MAG TPA: ABC transporter permease [Vicinamibacterales bacterium]|nr:ABC transporter permease [Vicinamibacterales bacterium]
MIRLVLRGVTFYWRSHLAVVLGVATAVAVLAGALLVGDSVRGSLRDLVLGRLGKTDLVIGSTTFFRDQLATDLSTDAEFTKQFVRITPLVVAQALVTGQESGRTAGDVRVYGVDDRFWRFHEVAGLTGPGDREAFVSPPLADRLATKEGDAILVRVQRPTDVPLETLHGRRENLGRTMRLTVRRVLPSSSLGEFSLEARQGDVYAVFVPLARMQRDLDVEGRVNATLVSSAAGASGSAAALEATLRRHTQIDDLGLSVKGLETQRSLSVGSSAGLLDDTHAAAVKTALAKAGTEGRPLFTYLANTLRVGDRDIPYSLVTATEWGRESFFPDGREKMTPDPIALTDWAATDLHARVGDPLTMDYYAWEEPGQLVTRSTMFRVAAVVPIAAGDRDMAPVFPGISDAPTLDNWDPPFPVDLRRVRKVDEQFWEQHRTTPKAFIPLDVGQRLWRTRYGAMTSIRAQLKEGQSIDDARQDLIMRVQAAADPLALGITVRGVRDESLTASRGATDFGEYFVYFSFFLVISALLLAALFFKLGIEQRVREVGLLRAVGFGPRPVRGLFLTEGIVLALVGSLLGVLGAIGYAAAIMYGLRTWWSGAVGTTGLTLHVSPASLVIGALGGIVAAVACIAWTLRSLNRVSERSLLAGQLNHAPDPNTLARGRGRILVAAIALAVIGIGLLMAGAGGWIDAAGAFFGAGSALLGATLCASAFLLRRRIRSAVDGQGWQSISRLGWRSAGYRPGRSVLSMAVIASATFILISVDAFRRGDSLRDSGSHSGVGGYSLLVETLLPVVQDPNSHSGREALNLVDLDQTVRFEPFRFRPGDDASCLNLYQPKNPRILAPTDAFLEQGRFAFQSSLATTDAERANPWLLLTRREQDGSIPVVADANSMTYVLHKQLGDEITITQGDRDIRLRLVAALNDSIFQGELLMSQENFVRLFPAQQGYRVMLVDAPADQAAEIARRIEDRLGDLGADATATTVRLAQFHQVENTYLSTFQTLGALGLLLGTVGLAAVIVRNVLERRRELALLGAVGYRRQHVLLMVLAENLLLVGGGLMAGAVCAGLAILPAVAERGGRVPLTSGGALLLFAVFVSALLSSVVAMRAATTAPLVAALHSE